MKVADVMTTEIHTLAPDTTWKQAAELFVRWGCSAAPVVDFHDRLIGMLSEKMLFRALFPSYGDWLTSPEAYLDFDKMERDAVTRAEDRYVREIMRTDLITTTPETPVLQVGALMVARNFHQVPVVRHGKVVGMVQRGTIYRMILKRYFDITHD